MDQSAKEMETAQALMDAGRYAEALPMLERLAAGGNVNALSVLGVMYQLGLGVPANGAKACSMLKAAADGGSGVAAHNLATLYVTGAPGCMPNRELSRLYLQRAVELGTKLGPDALYE